MLSTTNMNRQLTFLVAFLMAWATIFGQNPFTPDSLDPLLQKKLIIKNNVKSVKIYNCDTIKMKYSLLQFVFDKKGNAIEEIHCYDKQHYSFNFFYDSLGNEILCIKNNGDTISKNFNTINKKKQLIKQVCKYTNPKEYDRIVTTYNYNENGQLINSRMRSYHPEYSSNGQIIKSLENDSKTNKNLAFNETKNYFYNEKKQLIKIVLVSNKELIYEQFISYDQNGNVKLDRAEYHNNNQDIFYHEYSYNSSNFLSSIVLDPRPTAEIEVIYKLDSTSHLIPIESKPTKGEIIIYKNGLIQKTFLGDCYTYEYFPTDK